MISRFLCEAALLPSRHASMPKLGNSAHKLSVDAISCMAGLRRRRCDQVCSYPTVVTVKFTPAPSEQLGTFPFLATVALLSFVNSMAK